MHTLWQKGKKEQSLLEGNESRVVVSIEALPLIILGKFQLITLRLRVLKCKTEITPVPFS